MKSIFSVVQNSSLKILHKTTLSTDWTRSSPLPPSLCDHSSMSAACHQQILRANRKPGIESQSPAAPVIQSYKQTHHPSEHHDKLPVLLSPLSWRSNSQLGEFCTPSNAAVRKAVFVSSCSSSVLGHCLTSDLSWTVRSTTCNPCKAKHLPCDTNLWVTLCSRTNVSSRKEAPQKHSYFRYWEWSSAFGVWGTTQLLSV